ncbi:8620_t:CDS:1 [Funneliformis mosseae]|uniref:8620_t:CDS:1 n=1 Tax=Funneliformis mosseae TaxID=27381 RepID=A0A9N9A948_FUNMO|nr:8620_t:CDS:1 [Funneliformis mosseae]
MTEFELDPIAIYDNLVTLQVKPQSGGKNANNEAQLLSNLRIDTASVIKEIGRYRACDSGSCLYCREWASFVYKKNHTWTVKNQAQNVNGDNVGGNNVKKPKKAASDIHQHFCDLILQHGEKIKSSGSSNETADLVDVIVQKVFSWIKSPSNLYESPDTFAPVEFDTHHQVVPNLEHENDPSSLIDVIGIEKSHLYIQKDSFPLLKHISKVQQCNHTKPDWKYPSDIDLDRRVFNDHLFKEADKNEEALNESLGQVWSHVNNFLTSMLELEAKRDLSLGKGCLANLSKFLKEYQDECLLFHEYWAPVAEAYKKSGKSKKGTLTNLANVEDIDTAFHTYINNVKNVISLWEGGFIEKSVNDATQFGDEVQRTLVSILEESEERLVSGRVVEFHNNILQKCGDALRTVKDIKLLLSKRVSILHTEISQKSKELIQELEALEEAYKNESQKTTIGRLEKANNKEFRKRIKKIEMAVYGSRQNAIISIGNLFPVTDFTGIFTKSLEILMMEGEMWEAVQLGRHYKNYESTSQKLVSQRRKILNNYKEGIETGRKTLSGIIGRLFLKEAQRQQDETLALMKQESLLQSIEQGKQESGKKKKGEKDQSIAESVESLTPTESSKKSKKKKKKSGNVSATNTHILTPSMGKETGSESKSESPVDAKPAINPKITNHHENVNDSQKQLRQQQFLRNMITENSSKDTNSSSSMSSETASAPPLTSSTHDEKNKANGLPSKTHEINGRQLSVPPGLGPIPGDANPRPIPNGQTLPSNGIYDDVSKLNLDTLSRSDLTMLIQNLFTEKAQLVSTLISVQQEVKAMTDRYANLLEVARDREFQTIQMFETRKQQEMEEAMKYIQTLELRITQLEKQNHVGNNNESSSPKNSSSPGSPIGSSSTSQTTQSSSSGFSLFPTNRTSTGGSKKYSNPWRAPSSVRCGNCGDQGHVSQDCTIGCRYCGDLGHLSENCDSSILGGGSVNSDKSDKVIDQNNSSLI